MKKSKKFLSILSAAIMAIGCVGTSVSAYIIDKQIEVDGVLYDFEDYLKLLTPEEYLNAIASEISTFISSENLNAQVLQGENGNYYINENGKNVIKINFYYTHTDVQPTIEAFIQENNFDSSHVIFQSVGNGQSGEKITDNNEILALISDFIGENKLSAQANIESDMNMVIITIFNYFKKDEIEDAVNGFVKEKNIDESKITFLVLEQSILLGDINGDDKVNVRDCAFIASKLAKGEKLSDIADYNEDGKVNVRDAAAIARDLAKGKI